MTMPDPRLLDASPELVVQVAYIKQLRHLVRLIVYLALALVVVAGVGGYATWAAISAAHKVAVARVSAHDDTQAQITQLACGVVNQIPPDHGLADAIRAKYRCGPYVPPKAVLQPKPGVS